MDKGTKHDMSEKYDFNEINSYIKEYFVQMADLSRKGEPPINDQAPMLTPS